MIEICWRDWIFQGSIIYIVGVLCVSFGSFYMLNIDVRYIVTFGGLFILGLATGSIKPNLSAFAADQVGLKVFVSIEISVKFDESQKESRTQFFSFFYFAINVGSLTSVLITPLLRGRVKASIYLILLQYIHISFSALALITVSP